jgi:hypothetical protein
VTHYNKGVTLAYLELCKEAIVIFEQSQHLDPINQ